MNIIIMVTDIFEKNDQMLLLDDPQDTVLHSRQTFRRRWVQPGGWWPC